MGFAVPGQPCHVMDADRFCEMVFHVLDDPFYLLQASGTQLPGCPDGPRDDEIEQTQQVAAHSDLVPFRFLAAEEIGLLDDQPGIVMPALLSGKMKHLRQIIPLQKGFDQRAGHFRLPCQQKRGREDDVLVLHADEAVFILQRADGVKVPRQHQHKIAFPADQVGHVESDDTGALLDNDDLRRVMPVQRDGGEIQRNCTREGIVRKVLACVHLCLVISLILVHIHIEQSPLLRYLLAEVYRIQ